MKTQGLSYLIRRGKLGAGIILLLGIMLILDAIGSAGAQVANQLAKDWGTIVEQKSRAEEFVRMLKVAHRKGKIDDTVLERGQCLYSDGRAAFDGLISRLQFEIRAGQRDRSNTEEQIIRPAVEKSEAFTGYVEHVLFGKNRGPTAVVAAVAAVISALTNVYADIWNNRERPSQVDNERWINDLERLKWLPFSNIQ